MSREKDTSRQLGRAHELADSGMLEEAISICTELIEDDEDKIEALMLRAQCHSEQGEGDEAVSDHIQAIGLMNLALSPEERLAVAEHAQNINLSSDYCASLFTDAANELSGGGCDKLLVAGAFNKAGICLFRSGSTVEEERECFQKALAALESGEGDDNEIILSALIKSNLAECEMRDGEGEKAAVLYGEAGDVFYERLTDGDDMCLGHYIICQKCLSDIHRSRSDNAKAYACLTKSISELSRRSDRLSESTKTHLAVCYNARGTLRYQMGDYSGEVEDCTAALTLRESLPDDPSACGTILSNRAEAYAQLGRHEQAAADFLSAIDIFEGINDGSVRLTSTAVRYYSLAVLYFECNEIEEACDAFREAADRFSLAAASLEGEELEYTAEQLADMESVCRMRLAVTLSERESRDYYEEITQLKRAIELLEGLEQDEKRDVRLLSMRLSVGEIYEIFDELEAAEAEYAKAGGAFPLASMQEGSDRAADEDAEADEQLEEQRGIWENTTERTPQA